MQTITDFKIKCGSQIIHATHRSNTEHIVNGASSSLIFQGELVSRYCSNINAMVGDSVDVLDYMKKKLCSGIVVYKKVREWDMSKPVGKRLVSVKEF